MTSFVAFAEKFHSKEYIYTVILKLTTILKTVCENLSWHLFIVIVVEWWLDDSDGLAS